MICSSDIPEFVQDGIADIGITGIDLIKESESDVTELLDLKFGKTSLVLAAPEDSNIKSINDITPEMTLATEFPTLTRKYLEKNNLNLKIVKLSGSTEAAPFIGVADLITDQENITRSEDFINMFIENGGKELLKQRSKRMIPAKKTLIMRALHEESESIFVDANPLTKRRSKPVDLVAATIAFTSVVPAYAAENTDLLQETTEETSAEDVTVEDNNEETTIDNKTFLMKIMT